MLDCIAVVQKDYLYLRTENFPVLKNTTKLKHIRGEREKANVNV